MANYETKTCDDDVKNSLLKEIVISWAKWSRNDVKTSSKPRGACLAPNQMQVHHKYTEKVKNLVGRPRAVHRH